MDCAGLRADIDKLKRELQVLEENVEIIREPEEHNEELRTVAGLIGSDSPDRILAKYFGDFQAHNSHIIPTFT